VAGGHTLNIKQGSGPRNAAHPSRIRPGQRFFPLAGNSRRRFAVRQVHGEWALVDHEDGGKGRVSIDRLLASDDEGNGLYYRFHGWKRLPRGYRTEFEVVRICETTGRCAIALPEWDAVTRVETLLESLPDALRSLGARGSCRADLTAVSVGALQLHDFSAAQARGLSRVADGPHPKLLADGQEYRRRGDKKMFRLLEVDPAAASVAALSGGRVVRLRAARLLARRPDGEGLHFTYVGGGLSSTRKRRAKKK